MTHISRIWLEALHSKLSEHDEGNELQFDGFGISLTQLPAYEM